MRSGPRSRSRFPFPVFAPIAFLLLAVMAWRLYTRYNSNPLSPSTVKAGLNARDPRQPDVWGDIARTHRALNAVDAQTAYDSAKAYVLSRLPRDERDSATFSTWPPKQVVGDLADNTEIDRIAPYLWRVRGVVTWHSVKAGVTKVRERFETDLKHGPTDDKWRLIDTEWLDPSWMPDSGDADRDRK